MTETGAENDLCTACGVDIRPEALYCYHCGAIVETASTPPVPRPNTTAVSSVWFEEELVSKDPESRDEERAAPAQVIDITDRIPKPDSDLLAGTENAEQLKIRVKQKTRVRRKPQLTSAAALHRKSSSDRKMEIEVVWQERERSPNIWFIVMSLLVTLLVFGLFLLAMYLK